MKIDEVIISQIRQKYPQIKADDINVFDDGWDYVVCVVTDKEAYRFPRRDDYAKTLPNEVTFLNLFSPKSPVRVPRLTLHHLPDGKPFVTSQFISGVQFKRDVIETFPETKLLEVAGQMGKFLTVLHSFPLDKANEIGLEELNSFDSWSNRLVKIQKVVYPHIPGYEQEWIDEVFVHFFKTIKSNPFQNRVIHSDIMPEHIIVDAEKYTLIGIIDFGDIEIADPAYDFTFLRKYGQKFLKTAYEGYGLEIDETFEQRRQFYEDRLVVTNLEHSIELNDKGKILLHKKQLTDYIKGR